MNKRIANLHDVEAAARKKLPAMIYDYIAGASHEEYTRDRNRAAFQDYYLRLRNFVDVSVIDTTLTMLGTPVAAPIFVSPMGLLGGFHPGADIAAAQAARRNNLIFMHSAKAGIGIKEVAKADPTFIWAQLSFMKDTALFWQHVQDAKNAGVRTIIVMGDVALGSKRDRDYHHGLDSMPPKFSVRDTLNTATRPGWVYRYLTGRPFTWGNYQPGGKPIKLKQMIDFEVENRISSITWDDISKLRERWGGNLVIKGTMTTDDAAEAVDRGVDGIFVSNHGGRQLDGQPATLDVLPGIVDTVAGRAEIYLDGGIRRGEDIVKALALGATACGVARPAAYGLAAAGEKGVDRVLRILQDELRTVMGLTGTTATRQIGPKHLTAAKDRRAAHSSSDISADLLGA
ncbi:MULTISPECIES: alpha-hydroxy acid oxidase [unclassified Pseudarthrobacter]|uniref:alpha-hydroxy acid oxidase n=1 Tax=unclassified Pseudarthrobacter TaxID=2647000 RepID=UPI003077EC6E